MDIDRDITERVAPLHHRGEEVRVRDSNHVNASQIADCLDRPIVNQRNAVPEPLPSGFESKGALANGKQRFGVNRANSLFFGNKHVCVGSPEFFEGRPDLPCQANELPRITADRTRRRRLGTRGILRATGRTYVGAGAIALIGKHRSLLPSLASQLPGGGSDFLMSTANRIR
jgi:hypothetical protein